MPIRCPIGPEHIVEYFARRASGEGNTCECSRLNKCRDIGWVQSKLLSDKRMVVVRAAVADVRSAPEDGAPVVFRAERDVLLEIAESAASASTTAMPGWIKVRHRDGQQGFVLLSQVFGF